MFLVPIYWKTSQYFGKGVKKYDVNMICFYEQIKTEEGINKWGRKVKHSIGTLFCPGWSKSMFQAKTCQQE